MRKKEMIKRIEELEKENRELKHKDAQMYFFMGTHPEIKKEYEIFCKSGDWLFKMMAKALMSRES